VVALLRVTVATPAALVKAVVGVIIAWAASVLKTMTTLATAAPVPLNVALTVAGTPLEIEVTAAPVASVSASVIVGTGGVVGVPVVSDGTGVPPDPPEPQPARMAIVIASKSDAENVEISRLKKF
jgi:hypothetical protein